jgi:DNA-3-methyladenine glycosylase I
MKGNADTRLTMSVFKANTSRHRCEWAKSPLMVRYHDAEWGVPVHNDRQLFEFLILEGVQAGLSWATVLKKRPAYRKAFDNFNARKIARYSHSKTKQLLANHDLIRNRLKVASAVQNAKAFLNVRKEFDSFAAYIWRFVDGRPIVNARRSLRDIPARTRESDAMSKDLKRRGFNFVGSTICYAFMQAVGMVNDHVTHCFRYPSLVTRRSSRIP